MSTQAAIVIPIRKTTETGIPAISPVPNHRTPSAPKRLIGCLSFIRSARPRAIANIASVAMKGTTRP